MRYRIASTLLFAVVGSGFLASTSEAALPALAGFTSSEPSALVSALVSAPQPHGPTCCWELIWNDEFVWATKSVNPDPAKWEELVWHVQNVDTDPENSWVYAGKLVLNLSSYSKGALVRSKFQFNPGMVVEFRAKFVGNDQTDPIFNWPGVWAAGFRYPDSGEHDVAEGLKPGLKISYWDQNKDDGPEFGKVPAGDWNNAYHTFTLRRYSDHARVWWDGHLLADYTTNDDGGPEALLMSLGSTPGESPDLGKPSRMRVDYVRVWQR